MNRLIVFLLFIFTSLGIIAQRPRYEKMSPFVREAMASALATKQFTRSQSDDRLLTAFVRIDGNAAEVLGSMAVRSWHVWGDISIAAIPLSNLGAFVVWQTSEANRDWKTMQHTNGYYSISC